MLQEKIIQDYVQAMKSKDKERSQTLSFLRAQLKNVQIDKKSDTLSDEEVIGVVKKQVKQRKDSIEQFSAGNRQDLAQKEEAELNILKEYLPKEISDDALKAIIDEAINENKATTLKDMGIVMKAVVIKTAGAADNKTISQYVKQALS